MKCETFLFAFFLIFFFVVGSFSFCWSAIVLHLFESRRQRCSTICARPGARHAKINRLCGEDNWKKKKKESHYCVFTKRLSLSNPNPFSFSMASSSRGLSGYPMVLDNNPHSAHTHTHTHAHWPNVVTTLATSHRPSSQSIRWIAHKQNNSCANTRKFCADFPPGKTFVRVDQI